LKLKILVVYYSLGGNARWVAQTIAANVNADIEEVDLKRSTRLLGFLGISSAKKSFDDYDLIIVGTPVWSGKPTPAITAFLEKNDLSAKKVAVFFTQGNKKLQAIEETKALMPNSIYLGELALVTPLANKEESEKQIVAWCKRLTAI
jgi:flavodoxin